MGERYGGKEERRKVRETALKQNQEAGLRDGEGERNEKRRPDAVMLNDASNRRERERERDENTDEKVSAQREAHEKEMVNEEKARAKPITNIYMCIKKASIKQKATTTTTTTKQSEKRGQW